MAPAALPGHEGLGALRLQRHGPALEALGPAQLRGRFPLRGVLLPRGAMAPQFQHEATTKLGKANFPGVNMCK